jgi:hypothetical protein
MIYRGHDKQSIGISLEFLSNKLGYLSHTMRGTKSEKFLSSASIYVDLQKGKKNIKIYPKGRENANH